MFTETLKERGWKEEQEAVRYTKNDWVIVFDTNSWMEIGTKRNSRLADIAVPKRRNYKMAVDEIEKLCDSDDKN